MFYQSSFDQRWLKKVARDYRLANWSHQSSAEWGALLSRVDIITTGLVMAQAANESAWGKSRFAVQGNNLFGQRCYNNNANDEHIIITASISSWMS
jgi:Bax protein